MSDRRLLISDAPRDGVYYARVDGAWSDVATALAATPLANSTYLQGYELDGVTSVDLIGVNSSDWVEIGDTSNNTQYDGALHKFSADIELHGGNDLRIYDAGGTDYVNFSHNGTDFTIAATNTTGINVTGGAAWNFTGGGTVRVQDGALFAIYDSTDADYAYFQHDGTDFITGFQNTTDWNILGITTINTVSTVVSTNNVNVDGPNFDVQTTSKSNAEYAYKVTRNAAAVGGFDTIGRAYIEGTQVDGTDITNWNTAYGWGDHSTQNYAVTTGDTFTGTMTFSSKIDCTAEDADFAYGIHGGYSDGGDSTFGATIWSLDTSWNGAAAGNNSSSAGAYGIRWIRSTHTDAVSEAGEGLYQVSNGTVYNAMGANGMYTGNVTPRSDSTHYCGSSSKYWLGIYTDVINIGGATDTTITREAAGHIAVEGQTVAQHGSGQVNANYSSHDVFFSTSAASGGASGDIWYQYTA